MTNVMGGGLYEEDGIIPTVNGLNIGLSAMMLFVLSMWSWDLSAAHFNSGITVASLLFNYKKLKKNLYVILLYPVLSILWLIIRNFPNLCFIKNKQYLILQ